MLLSVIVPIYNATAYLKKCVDSILVQTYKNMEIILIDDGSNDGSEGLCEQYGEKDSRIKVFHKENGGLISARKAGLVLATGTFIGFVDADDWIEPTYYEQMMKQAINTGADIIAAGHWHEIGQEKTAVYNGIETGVYAAEDIIPQMLLYQGEFFTYGIQPHLWNKVIKKDILMKTLMMVNDEIPGVFEDAATVYPSILKSEKICVTKICAYHYVQRSSSLTAMGTAKSMVNFPMFIRHLEDIFLNSGNGDILLPQLAQYKKYCLLLRNIQELENVEQKILMPYGGIDTDSRLVLYGAGALGRRIYSYLNPKVEIILWVDRNAQAYQADKLPVEMPEKILELRNAFDCIVIANTVKSTADAIKKYLLDIGVKEEKIRWLSKSFLEE